MLEKIKGTLYDNKAENVLVYENVKYTGDAYIVASCLSNKHTKAIAQYIIQEIKHNLDYTVEGLDEGNWVMIDVDCGLAVHIFCEPVRKYYAVDELWGDTKKIVHNSHSYDIF